METGLYYLRARYYDPRVGRFISEDPKGPGGGINPFVYAANNPMNFTDPRGLDCRTVNHGTSVEVECDADEPEARRRAHPEDQTYDPETYGEGRQNRGGDPCEMVFGSPCGPGLEERAIGEVMGWRNQEGAVEQLHHQELVWNAQNPRPEEQDLLDDLRNVAGVAETAINWTCGTYGVYDVFTKGTPFVGAFCAGWGLGSLIEPHYTYFAPPLNFVPR